MKGTVELDTVGISDKLNRLKDLTAMIAISMIGVDENPNDDAIEGIAQVAWQIHEGLIALSDEVHPNGTWKPDSDEEPQGKGSEP